jgi:F0F1-type ATP synthase alpha subunit
VPLSEQVAVLYAGTQGHLDKVPVARVREWEASFVRYLKSERAGVLEEIDRQKALDDALFARLNAAISTFNHQFGVEGYKEEPDPAPAAAASAPAPDKPAAKTRGKK